MKTKNVILGLVVLFCAIGSAIASKILLPQPTWVKGTVFATGAATCSTINNVCDPTGGDNCEVQIQLRSGTIKSTVGYSVETGNVCSIPHATNTVYGTIVKSNLSDVETYFE